MFAIEYHQTLFRPASDTAIPEPVLPGHGSSGFVAISGTQRQVTKQ